MHLVDGVGELAGELEVGRAGFAPHQVGVVRHRRRRGEMAWSMPFLVL